MRAEERRQCILERLRKSTEPVNATTLAGLYSVSRQVIVGDIALLRAAGSDITATPRGYIIFRPARGLRHQIACQHGADGMEAELSTIVDCGCIVSDVIVEHPIYGQLTGHLEISCQEDVQNFIQRCREADAQPLSRLTEGIHLHTIFCPDEDSYQQVLLRLRGLNILLEN
ncbi:MAG: transcription repressor NadR [Candidatus Limivicinus sp.]|jgi:transcriptional regulator of NAD metabolism